MDAKEILNCPVTPPNQVDVEMISPEYDQDSLECSGVSIASSIAVDGLPSPPPTPRPTEVDERDERETSREERETQKEVSYEWLGTSQFYVEEVVALQLEGHLQIHIAQRNAMAEECVQFPFDPRPLLTLAYLHTKLGFLDISTANAFRALTYIETAFDNKSPSALRLQVQNAVCLRLRTSSPLIVRDTLLEMQLEAYKILITGLLGTSSYFHGMKYVRKARKLYPNNSDLMQLESAMKDGFEDRLRSIPIDVSHERKRSILQRGDVYQKPYPWLDPVLSIRTTKLLAKFNEYFQQGNCEVRRAFFGPNALEDAKRYLEKGADVGPLGIFATRDIQAGEAVMVDSSLISVTNTPPAKLEQCDACRATLLPPYLAPEDVVHTKCCRGKVAFCSKTCHDKALEEYHTVLCGKDFDWMFENIIFEAAEGMPLHSWRRWRAMMLLRIIAIIVSGNNKLPASKKVHPLAHPLTVRMTAAYPTTTALYPASSYDFNLFEDVIAPTKILTQLDLIHDPWYSQEVITTLYHRIENNSSQATIELQFENHVKRTHAVTLSPNYLFFNHSCTPNIDWHSTPPSSSAIGFLRGMHGELLRPGESAVWCLAARDIRKGEELKISYVGDALEDREAKRLALGKWCENGCGCEVCEAENAKAAAEIAGGIGRGGHDADATTTAERGMLDLESEMHLARTSVGNEDHTGAMVGSGPELEME